MASTIDSISHGRFGLNLITGWQRPEYSQMGLWPGDEYFSRRYEYLSEYVEILRDLWTTGVSDRKGAFFQMDDCRLSPPPQADIKVICAGQSGAGLAFSAKYADYNFCFGKGVNTPKGFASAAERLTETTKQTTGRHVTTYVLFMLIADKSDAAAFAKWERYKAGVDHEAVDWLGRQGAADTRSGADTNIRQMADPASAVNINMGTLVGSFENIARMLDEAATVPGTEGIMLTFDDFVEGIDNFGRFIQPLMKSRLHLDETADVA
jgi:pyrimidine oxygenase